MIDGRLDLETAVDRIDERAPAVDRLTERVDHPSEETIADGDGEDAARGLDGLALLDSLGRAEHDRADRLLVEVECEAERAVLELEQLVHTRLRQPGDVGDAVADLGHAAHRLGLDRRVEAFEVLAQRRDDVVGVDRELCHWGPFLVPTTTTSAG